jgi:hypothetical protein
MRLFDRKVLFDQRENLTAVITGIVMVFGDGDCELSIRIRKADGATISGMSECEWAVW